MKAIYVHGLGSGAATSALSTLGRHRIVVEGKGGHRLGSASVHKIKEIILKFLKGNNDCRNLAD